MSHNYHEGLPGFAPDQLLHDGCRECMERAAAPDHGIGNLDPARFARAWERAAAWQASNWPGEPLDLSTAEVPMLWALWAVQVQLQRRGVPIGQLPTAVSS